MAITTEEKKLWVDALRSGDYKQTKGTLHNLDDEGFCCLGLGALVLGIASKEGMGVTPYTCEDGEKEIYDEGPGDVYDYWREKTSSDVVNMLTKMNDYGDTFAEIADWIEEKL
jgi:hypothetical protein